VAGTSGALAFFFEVFLDALLLAFFELVGVFADGVAPGVEAAGAEDVSLGAAADAAGDSSTILTF
jgi:hypothetical protein